MKYDEKTHGPVVVKCGAKDALDSFKHRWVPIGECGELRPGTWLAKCGGYTGEMFLHNSGDWFARFDDSFSQAFRPELILNPHLGPIPEVGE